MYFQSLLAFTPFIFILGFYALIVYGMVKFYHAIVRIGAEMENIRIILGHRLESDTE